MTEQQQPEDLPGRAATSSGESLINRMRGRATTAQSTDELMTLLRSDHTADDE